MPSADVAPMLYPIGENDTQTRRLITQAQLYDPSTRTFFQAAGIGRGMKVLELGSGVGDDTLILADLVGASGRVVGVELKEAAVETARQRINASGWRNVEFLAGDINEVSLEADFDAVAGRFILMWLPDPLAVLRRVTSHLRPGGIVAFQDNDFTFGVLASKSLPVFDRLRAIMDTGNVSGGPDFHMGLKLPQLYQEAGLPPPQMTMDVPLGTGPDWSGYHHLADTLAMLAPLLQQRGIPLPVELEPSTLAQALRDEATQNRAVLLLPAILGAWSRKT